MLKLAPRFVPLFVLTTLIACKAEEKPDAFMRATLDAAKGQPRAVWDALPPSYQKDANDVVAAFAAKVPAEPYNDGFVIAAKLAKVLETQKTFVLGHPMLQSGPIKAADLEKAWDPAVRMLSTLVNSEIKSVDGLKKLDIGAFIAGPLAAVLKDAMATAESAGGAIPGDGADQLAKLKAKLNDTTITVEKVDGEKATIKVVTKGEPEELVEMVKVEGKWLPKDLVAGWPVAIASAKASISEITIVPEMLVQFNMMKGMITPVLDGLLAAKTQEEFNAQIEGAMKLAGGPGGPGGPGPGDSAPVADAAPADEEPAKPSKGKPSKKKRRSGD